MRIGLNWFSLYLITGVSFAYVLADSMSIRVNDAQKVSYVLFFGISTVATGMLLAGRFLRTPCFNRNILAAVFFVSLFLSFIPQYLGSLPVFYLRYFMSDLVSYLLVLLYPVLIYLLRPCIDLQFLAWLAGLLIVAFVIGFLSCTDCYTRYEPPHFIVLAILLVLFAFKRGYARTVHFSLFFVVLLLMAYSGERTSLFLGFFLAFFYLMNKSWVAAASAAVALFASLLVAPELLVGRFAKLEDLSSDSSLVARYNELLDVFSFFQGYGSPFNYLFGFGFSATYLPYEYSGVDLNLTEEGRLHSIHFFPMLVAFRFGLFGLLLYLWFALAVLKELLLMTVRGFHRYNPVFCFSVLAMSCFLLESMMRNVFVDVFFFISLGIFAAFYRRRFN